MIYTRTGDHGTTDLANGERCAKTDDRMEAVGALDELNAHLGLLLCQLSPEISDKLKRHSSFASSASSSPSAHKPWRLPTLRTCPPMKTSKPWRKPWMPW